MVTMHMMQHHVLVATKIIDFLPKNFEISEDAYSKRDEIRNK